MKLSDSQLMLLEQLTYADENLFNKLEIYDDIEPENKLLAISELTYEEINSLKGKKIKDSTVSGDEWADILCAIKSDPDLMSLTCKSYDNESKGYCYVSKSGDAYVTFRGTDGGEEWKDNVEGLGLSDTPCQKKALKYIENLQYDNITVCGHSKGGNKAQYVTITSDKVNRCISMDGQGFSKEFIDKYSPEIEQKGKLIKNYSYKDDFVHILMNYVPKSQQIYCTGTNTGIRCHNPNGMFKLKYNEKSKKWEAYFQETEENTGMKYLHGFTCFVANNMPIDERKSIGSYLGNILSATMANGTFKVNGKEYTSKNIFEYIMSDSDSASSVIAYLMKYIKTYNLSKEDALNLMKAFNIKGALAEVIWVAIDTLGFDGESNIDHYLSIYQIALKELGETVLDTVFLNKILAKAKAKYINIRFNNKNFRGDYKSKPGKKHDFSANSFEVITNAIKLIDSSTYNITSSWNSFSNEDWYSQISAGIVFDGIDNYFEKLHSVNSNSKRQIQNAYCKVYGYDSLYSNKIKTQVSTINSCKRKIISLTNALG